MASLLLHRHMCALMMEDLKFTNVVVVSCLIFIIKLLQQMITKENMDIFSSSDRVFQNNSTKVYMLAVIALHQHHMINIFSLFPDLGHRVKPRSIVWFSRFLFTKYDDHYWVQNFKMAKGILFDIVNQLRPMVAK